MITSRSATAAPRRILLIDDDCELVNLLVDYLALEGFIATPAHSGEEGLAALAENSFDLIILDVMMPDMSGVEVLSRIRQACEVPVLMLTARGDPVDRILGLELGADDYVPKPCPPRELVARVRAILRRGQRAEEARGPVTVGPLYVDLSSRVVQVLGQSVSFTGTEMAILDMLARHSDGPVVKDDISRQVLGRPMGRNDRAVDVHISSIRHKLARAAPDLIAIESVRGVGYHLVTRGETPALG